LSVVSVEYIEPKQASMNLKLLRKSDLLYLAAAVALFLLVPAVAMLFTDAVRWSFFDFVVAALLLSLAGSAVLLIRRLVHSVTWRVAGMVLVLLLLLLLWVELAVGIFGSPWAGS
jgi:hypothetical protein